VTTLIHETSVFHTVLPHLEGVPIITHKN